MNLTALLDETTPVDHDLPSDSMARARARLDIEMTAAAQRIRLARRAKRRRLTAVSLVSVAAAASLVVAPVLDLRGVHQPDAAEAAVVLVSAAAAAGKQAGGWADAPYWHVVTEQARGDDSYPVELWFGRTANSVIQDGSTHYPTADLGADAVYTTDIGKATFSAGNPVDWAGLYALPTDPTKLEHLLRHGGKGQGTSPDSQLWSDIGQLQLDSPASPALRAALWTVASRISHVQVLGTMTDSVGRSGTAVERDPHDGWYRERYIIDPETGDVLEELSYDADGDVAWRTTVLSQGPADEAPDADPPICGPGSVPERSC